MELLELLIPLIDFCGCFLEMSALGANVGAGASAVREAKRRKLNRTTPVLNNPPRTNWGLIILVALAVFLTGLVAFKYLR